MSNIAQLPDHVAGDQYTADMWTAVEGNINDGIVTQRGTQVHRTGDKTIAASALVAVDFDVEDRDADGMWDVANPTRLTCQTAGWYHLAGHLSFSADSTGQNREALLQLNGADYIAKSGRNPNGGTSATNVSVGTVYYLNVGDYVELIGHWDATASGTLNSLAQFGNYFRACRL